MIEIQSIGAFLLLFKMALLVIGILLIIRIVWIFSQILNEENATEARSKLARKFWRHWGYFFGFIILTTLLSTVAPKYALDTNKSQYKVEREAVSTEMKPSESRTETLNGFTPLKK